MDSVVALIGAEHSALRGRLAKVVRTCRAALHDEKRRAEVVAELRQLVSAIREHLAYEEEALLPLLRESDAWGAARVELLKEEHERQRETLVALLEDANEGTRSLAELVDEIVWFARSFEKDMQREEAGLAAASEVVVADQIDG
jgi:iron-sulfur cluster repair protein YtfE (RIC family)